MTKAVASKDCDQISDSQIFVGMMNHVDGCICKLCNTNLGLPRLHQPFSQKTSAQKLRIITILL